MYIRVYVYGQRFQWLLFSHTGLVMARSDSYARRCDASRVGKRVAGRLGIEFKD